MSALAIASIFSIVTVLLLGTTYIRAWIDKQRRLTQLNKVRTYFIHKQ